MNTKTLSFQMLDVLRLLDREGPMTARQLNDSLYQPASPQSRRVFAASMSRTIRRLRRRGLIFYEGRTIAITHSGWITIHPEQVQEMVSSLCESIRTACKQAWLEYQQSQGAPTGG